MIIKLYLPTHKAAENLRDALGKTKGIAKITIGFGDPHTSKDFQYYVAAEYYIPGKQEEY